MSQALRAAPLHLMTPVAILTGDYFIDDEVATELQALGARIHFKPCGTTTCARLWRRS